MTRRVIFGFAVLLGSNPFRAGPGPEPLTVIATLVKPSCDRDNLEARTGFEPVMTVLQTVALPLGDRAASE
jgi:hypothetical protein